MADQNWTVESNDYRLEALSLALDYVKTGLMGADPKAEKVVATTQAAEQRAEIERLTALVAELQGLLATHDICADILARKQEERP